MHNIGFDARIINTYSFQIIKIIHSHNTIYRCEKRANYIYPYNLKGLIKLQLRSFKPKIHIVNT